MSCIFCKIIGGEIPSHKVYEDDKNLAFLDISPVNPGHILVIPKKHFSNMEEAPENDLCELMKAVKKVGRAMKDGLGADGYNINVNNDPVAGQIIPHLHFHIIPRTEGDGLKLWAQSKYKEGEAEETAKKIVSGL